MPGDVIFVVGARPNFMKVAPMLRVFEERGRFGVLLVHTGQHYDEGMSDVFFQQLRIRPPDVSLGVGSGTHGAQTAKILAAFEELLVARGEQTAGVVVVGDVNSTVACSLAAVKLGIRVAHVEAGLRSFDRTMPEEINRVLTDAIADLLMVTEASGERNLAREGMAAERIHLVGNVMIDTLYAELPAARALAAASHFGVEAKRFAFLTLHRPSNVDDAAKLAQLVEAVLQIGERLPLVFPVHPRTADRLARFGLLDRLRGTAAVKVVEPLGYHQSLSLIDSAAVVITDSGGIQEETSALGVPCLTLRSNTERPVTIDLGTNTLVGEDVSRLVQLIDEIVGGRYKTGSRIPLWDGHAADRIADVVEAEWGKEPTG